MYEVIRERLDLLENVHNKLNPTPDEQFLIDNETLFMADCLIQDLNKKDALAVGEILVAACER